MDGKNGGSQDNGSYDGVVYESTRNLNIRENSRYPRKNRQQKNNMAAFYILTLIIAIVLCMIIFALVFQATNNRGGSSAAPDVTTPAVTAGSAPISMADLTDCSGVIQIMDPSGTWIEILDVASNTPYRLTIKDITLFEDKSGAPLLINEFTLGEIVDARYDINTNDIHTLKKSSKAWVLRERDNIKIDTITKTITAGNDRYSYNDHLITLHNNQRFSLDLVQPMDVLTIAGVDLLAWSVTLVKGHGSLYISNAGEIINGTLEINNDIFQKLGDVNPIYLPEGSHHLVIKGDNIETFMREVFIGANKSEYIRLEDDIKLKIGWLNIQVNTQDYILFVDNEEHPPGLPISLAYGEHTIRVEKEGYITAERVVVINELSSGINIELNAKLRLGRIIADSDPQGAKVYVDSAYVGDTPVNVNIEMGPHTLLISKDGYNQISFSINVDRDTEPFEYFFELTPVQDHITINPFLPPVQQTDDPTFPTENPYDLDLPADLYFPDIESLIPFTDDE